MSNKLRQIKNGIQPKRSEKSMSTKLDTLTFVELLKSLPTKEQAFIKGVAVGLQNARKGGKK